jgi:hypothetical protein
MRTEPQMDPQSDDIQAQPPERPSEGIQMGRPPRDDDQPQLPKYDFKKPWSWVRETWWVILALREIWLVILLIGVFGVFAVWFTAPVANKTFFPRPGPVEGCGT